jgi:hypothetical protein
MTGFVWHTIVQYTAVLVLALKKREISG